VKISPIGVQTTSKTNRKLITSSFSSSLSFRKSDIQSCDSVLFSSKPKLLLANEDEEYATKYRNSTAGYRGEFGKNFNDDFVYTMTNAASEFMIKHKNSSVPKGYKKEIIKNALIENKIIPQEEMNSKFVNYTTYMFGRYLFNNL